MTRAIADPALQSGHVEQNQNTAAIIAAQGGDEAEGRVAYALDDPATLTGTYLT